MQTLSPFYGDATQLNSTSNIMSCVAINAALKSSQSPTPTPTFATIGLLNVVKGDEYISLINQQTPEPVIGPKTGCEIFCTYIARYVYLAVDKWTYRPPSRWVVVISDGEQCMNA